jgi:hypothetical protein
MKGLILKQQDKVAIEIAALIFIFILACIFTGIVFSL